MSDCKKIFDDIGQSEEFTSVEDLEQYDETTVSLHHEFEQILNSISTSKMELIAVNYQLKNLQERFLRDRKRMYIDQLDNQKPRNQIDPKSLPETLLMSDQLCHFLKEPIGSVGNRVSIFEKINDYIKKNNLKDRLNITIDSRMASVFGHLDEVITYFTIQQRLSPHLCPLKDIKIDLKNE